MPGTTHRILYRNYAYTSMEEIRWLRTIYFMETISAAAKDCFSIHLCHSKTYLCVFVWPLLLLDMITYYLCCSISRAIFSIGIQIRWKVFSGLTQVIVKWSLWHFAHGTTAVLSWYVQNFVAISYPTMEFNFSLNLNYDGKIIREMSPCMYNT